MCFGLPARVVSVSGGEARVVTGSGSSRRVALALPERVRKGDFVVLMGDTAFGKIDRRSALESMETMEGLALSALDDGGDAPAIKRLYRRRAERLAGRRE